MNKVKRNLLKYWVEGFWILLFSYNALVTSFLGAVIHTDFFSMPHNEQLLVMLSVTSSWSITMMALMVTIARKLDKGKDLLSDEGNTQMITKEQVAQQDKQNEKTNPPNS